MMDQKGLVTRRFYGNGIPNIKPSTLKGHLIVVEGADGSGRSTQVAKLKEWLEGSGYPTTEIGLKRSSLVGSELEVVMQGHTLSPLTFFLYYATDFADQLENVIIPALRSDFVVLADRYIYTLMARDIIRGADPEWVKDVYGFALIPDAVFYLSVDPMQLAERSLRKNQSLDYWESGMDIRRHGNMYECFVWYQQLLKKTLDSMSEEYGFTRLNGDMNQNAVFAELREKVKSILNP